MAKKKKDRTDELLSELIKGKSPEEILGEGGVLKQLTKRLVENALEGETLRRPSEVLCELLHGEDVSVLGLRRKILHVLDHPHDATGS